MKRLLLAALTAVVLSAAEQAQAQPVGELHRVTTDESARLRNADHSTSLRITVWYPAAKDSTETPLLVGPPDKPLFDIGQVAPDAVFATDSGPHPVILLSHGFGGSARIMGWFGIAMARNGFIVIAVDHPGNNAVDKMTLGGAVLWWDRAEDLRIALQAIKSDPTISPHLDATRIAAAGFSAGGATTLVLARAQADPRHFQQFCATHPTDGVCLPPREFSITRQDVERLFQTPEMQAEAAHAAEDHSIPDLRAAFVIAPTLVQALEPVSLTKMQTPTSIILGDADTVAPPATNGVVAAEAIPGAQLQSLRNVGHYDFLATCTEAGRALIPFCDVSVPQAETHDRTLAAARAFFTDHLAAR